MNAELASLAPSDGVRFANRLPAWVVAGCAGGIAVGVIDAARALSTGQGMWTALALLEVCATAGLALGLAGLAGLTAVNALHARFPRVRPAFWQAVLLALGAWPLGLRLFSGAGVGRTWLGSFGPWLVPPLASGIGVGLVALLCGAATRGAPTRALAAFACLLAAAGLTALDRWLLPGLYFYLHVLWVLGAIGAAALAFGLLVARATASDRAAPVLFALTGLAFPAVTVGFPHDNDARTFLVEARPAAARLMNALSAVADIDGDGASALFRGPDCNDLDPAIGPGQVDAPGNGIDEDCDDEDATAAVTRRPHTGNRNAAAEAVRLAQGRPTVVLVIDALRADSVRADLTPNLERLARESIWFTHAFAPASSTAFSVPAMITGRVLPAARDASAFERLMQRGRGTALVTVDAVLGSINGQLPVPHSLRYPLQRGFARREIIATEYTPGRWGGGVRTPTDDAVTARAFSLLDGADPPAAVLVHYYDLHQWKVLDGGEGQGIARYDHVLRRVDRMLGRWLARADRLNLIVTADHGESLGAGSYDHHTQFLWANLVRVPLLIRIPGLRPATVSTPVSLLDLAATLLELHGLAAAAELPYSLLSLVDGAPAEPGTFPAVDSDHVSLLDGRHRVIVDQRSRAVWLFDVLADPDEQTTIGARQPDLARTMAAAAQAFEAHARARRRSLDR